MARLQGGRLRLLKTEVPNALHGITQRSDAQQAHLYRIKTNADGYQTGALLYTSADQRLTALERFPFQLFSEALRNYLLADHSTIVTRASTHPGGQLVDGILEQTNCRAYLLCPILVKNKLRGLLGIAARDSSVFENKEVCRLLKFNGMSLFWSIRNTRREARHRRRFSKWKQIADQACDLAFTIDESRIIKRAIAPGRSTSLTRLEGRYLTELVDPPFHAELAAAIGRSIEKSAVRTANFRMTTGEEASRWYAARIEPAALESKTITLYLTDNHADQSRQEEVRALQTQLRKTERLRLLGKMSTEFAHQLTQPLQAMLTYCNMLQKHVQKGTNSREDSLRRLGNIEASIEHSNMIIHRIREFVGERRLTIKTVSLRELLNSAILLVSPSAQDLNAVLVAPESGLDVEVEADATQTAHILVNLIVNSLEACRDFDVPNPRIEIMVNTHDTSRVTVSVKDNGPGLPEDRIEDLFGEFRSEKEGGVGIGLTMSRDICRAQGGDLVAANNSDGPGCTFRFTLTRTDFDSGDTVEMEPIRIPAEIRD